MNSKLKAHICCPQVAKQILKNSEDKTQISLIYANQMPDDILLWDEIEEMAAKHDNFKVHYVGEFQLSGVQHWYSKLLCILASKAEQKAIETDNLP